MKNSYLSFIVPVYIDDIRYVSFLKDTIEGIKEQTDKRWYAIFIDDCSPINEVRSVLLNEQENDSRFKPIFLTERLSTGECRNIGIRKANEFGSSVIMFNDADDISHRKRVELVRKYMGESKCDMLYSDFIPIDEQKNIVTDVPAAIKEILRALENPPEGDKCWIKFATESGYTNITSSTNVKTSLALQEPFPDSYISEDMHTWYRYSARGQLLYKKDFPTKYRIPTFVKRQSSERYTEDFNMDKYLIDKDGFEKALMIEKLKNKLSDAELESIRIKFFLRLSQSFENNNRFDLVNKITREIEKMKGN